MFDLTAPHEVVVELRGITKRFGAVVANDGISLAVRRGEIHAVLGENGAGKTTLMNVLAGMFRPDAGEIRVGGEPVVLASPRDALRLGIATVYQHLTLVPNLSVVENVVLGADAGAVLDLEATERRLGELLRGLELEVKPRTQVRHLSTGQRQRVEILKALDRGSRVLLLDEPTSVLSPTEVDGLFRILLRLKAEGVAIVLITHKLREALAVSDRLTVLRAGRTVAELGAEELAGTGRAAVTQRVVGLMFDGAGPASERDGSGGAAQRPAGPTALSLSRVTVLGDRGTPAVQDLSLDLHAGEVFGVAGVDGNGQTELAEAIAGQRAAVGRIALRGADATNRGTVAAARAGIGYVTDDRLGEGCVAAGSVAENLALKAIDRPPFARGPFLDRRAMEANARRLIEEYDVRAPGPAARIGSLSGGNVQKLLLARELALAPAVLVCNKPTHGLDLKTARFVLGALRGHADTGNVVLLISSELDELLEVSDRIGVMYNGRLAAVFARGEADAETIGRLMLGGRP